MTIELRRIDDRVWEIPKHGGMRVPGRIYASARQMADLAGDPCLQQGGLDLNIYAAVLAARSGGMAEA